MPGNGTGPKPALAPKIIQVCTNMRGTIAAILYANGRVFTWNHKAYNVKTGVSEGWWGELAYPDLKQSEKSR